MNEKTNISKAEPEQFHTPMWVLTTFVIVSFGIIAVAIRGMPLP
jgi:hypothetical protein